MNQYTTVGAANYTYDVNGNMANDGTYKYYYDRKNRLSYVTNQGDSMVAWYLYDYLDRRVHNTKGGGRVK